MSCTSNAPWIAFWITVSVRSPRKSIFKRPNSSNVTIVYCVVMLPSEALDSGTNSSTGFGLITTPAAWTEVCRGSPSKRIAISISFFAESSVSYIVRSSGFIFIAFAIVIPSSIGIAFATLSTYAYGRSNTRPTSRITIRADIVPNVTICTTWSAPYFLVT